MSLKAVNISKSYGSNMVLSDFSHEFEDGKVTAIMGASGCGKTTLLSVLMGLTAPDSGEVLPKGIRMSAVFQENRLCENLTAAANIRLVTGKKYSPQQLEKELAAVGITDVTNKPIREFSGGMKRRVALVRALLADYDVLFMDEPFKGLDEETKRQVMEYCKEKTAGRTVIFVTHDKDECDFLSDEIINME